MSLFASAEASGPRRAGSIELSAGPVANADAYDPGEQVKVSAQIKNHARGRAELEVRLIVVNAAGRRIYNSSKDPDNSGKKLIVPGSLTRDLVFFFPAPAEKGLYAARVLVRSRFSSKWLVVYPAGTEWQELFHVGAAPTDSIVSSTNPWTDMPEIGLGPSSSPSAAIFPVAPRLAQDGKTLERAMEPAPPSIPIPRIQTVTVEKSGVEKSGSELRRIWKRGSGYSGGALEVIAGDEIRVAVELDTSVIIPREVGAPVVEISLDGGVSWKSTALEDEAHVVRFPFEAEKQYRIRARVRLAQ